MEDVLRRLGSLEKDVSVIKVDVAGVVAVLPHLATKADVALVRVDIEQIRANIAEVKAQIPNLATKADLRAEIAGVRTEIATSNSSHIRWTVGTMIALLLLAFTIEKLVH